MASKYGSSVTQLMKNPKDQFIRAANLLIRIARNIENNPTVEKYKSVPIGSKTFMESLLSVDGAIQCLLEMGFEESNDRFVFSQNSSNDVLHDLKEQLENAVHEARIDNAPSVLNPSGRQRVDNGSNSKTYKKLQSCFQHVLTYEDASLQEKARSVVPRDRLTEEANADFEDGPLIASKNGPCAMKYEDCFIVKLLAWFKYEFFKWVNSPKCPNCPDAKTYHTGMVQPSADDLKWGAYTVESHACNNCGANLRFPRYNHPEKLLETRGGRCGEWANCFTLICRSFGYHTRHVIDWTDHVWTEYYSLAAERWVHLDPCENAFDKPLMYEKGWSKKLSLIVACSCDEIVDVTWRYSDKHKDVISRRKVICNEEWLQKTLQNMNKSRQAHFLDSRKAQIEYRFMAELVELSSPKLKRIEDYEGRTTGSLEWRRARGELGKGKKDKNKSIIWLPELGGAIKKELKLTYYSKDDKYYLHANLMKNSHKRYDTLVHYSTNMKRKKEHDWKMVYLCRDNSSTIGHICWKFQLKDTDAIIKQISLKVQSDVFHSGKVEWLLCSEKKSFVVKNGVREVFKSEISDAKSLTLHAFLTGGDGENAWQHAQLFRTSLDAVSDNPQMEISLVYASARL